MFALMDSECGLLMTLFVNTTQANILMCHKAGNSCVFVQPAEVSSSVNGAHDAVVCVCNEGSTEEQ